jgi:probable HAF family extracellular repeat protein
VTIRDDGIMATGLNARGDLIGFEWLESKEHPGVMDQVPFLARGKDVTYLPRLKGYTATFPNAISEDGTVVGRAAKPGIPGVRTLMRTQAFVWDAKTGMRGLGILTGDYASEATGISRDGRRISGYSVGDDTLHGCFWDRTHDGWSHARPVPQAEKIRSNTVAISDDGRRIAAVHDTIPCLWTEDLAGKWTREELGLPGSLVPRDVNDQGTVVGVRYTHDGAVHAAIWTREGGLKLIEEPKGYARSEASAVNNQGVVVGMVDGPNASKEFTPHAFVYEGGRMRLMDEGGPNLVAATTINDAGQVGGVFEKEEEVEAPEKADKPK